MKKTALVALVSVAMTLPAFAQNKIDDRLGNSAEVLKQILAKADDIPQAYLNKAKCVLVFPGVKKVAVGIGGTYGRGVIVCRTGANMILPLVGSRNVQARCRQPWRPARQLFN